MHHDRRPSTTTVSPTTARARTGTTLVTIGYPRQAGGAAGGVETEHQTGTERQQGHEIRPGQLVTSPTHGYQTGRQPDAGQPAAAAHQHRLHHERVENRGRLRAQRLAGGRSRGCARVPATTREMIPRTKTRAVIVPVVDSHHELVMNAVEATVVGVQNRHDLPLGGLDLAQTDGLSLAAFLANDAETLKTDPAFAARGLLRRRPPRRLACTREAAGVTIPMFTLFFRELQTAMRERVVIILKPVVLSV